MKKIALLIAAALVCTSLVACKHFSNPHDPERMVQTVEKHIEKVLDSLDVTVEQRKKIDLITEQIIADAQQVSSQHAEDRGKIVACIMLDDPASEWLHSKVEEKAKAWTEFSHRSIDRFVEISAVLTTEQRVKLKEKFAAAHGAKQ